MKLIVWIKNWFVIISILFFSLQALIGFVCCGCLTLFIYVYKLQLRHMSVMTPQLFVQQIVQANVKWSIKATLLLFVGIHRWHVAHKGSVMQKAWPHHDVIMMWYLINMCAGFSYHYIDVIMTTMASQITSLTVVYSTVYSDADQRKHQSSASLVFVWGIHRDRWIPRTKGQLRGKCFHLMTSSCECRNYSASK